MTVAAPRIVKVHVLVLFPPLEQAPDQTASRPLLTANMIAVPVAKDAEPLLPTETPMPDGLEVIRSPLRPMAGTVSVTVDAGAATVKAADRATPRRRR